MKIAIGCDHGGIDLKKTVEEVLSERGIEIVDCGTYSKESCDYPDFAKVVAIGVASGLYDKGILMCGTGIGISIAANKVKGVRAAVCHDVFTAQMSSAHNNANILCLGARVLTKPLASDMIKVWLDTPFEGGRHSLRVEKISDIEKCCTKQVK